MIARANAVGARRHWRRAPIIADVRVRWALYAGTLVYVALSYASVDVNWGRVRDGAGRGLEFVLAFFTPDFVSRWDDIAHGFAESLAMTGAASVLGVLVSVPIGLGAARNLAPPPVYLACRGVIAVSRAFQEVIVAIIFVAMFGFGPFAGVLTLTFATVGFLSKLLAEDIESIDPDQVESIRATGADWLQLMNYAVQPQVAPRLVGLMLYRM
ncbi:MAG: ABC transporter permease subunit, partial [Gammaproteobacteria bacterium]|nr:ABC transporter permease subunit [Gammaproteobacteria bacterium]NIR97746.1 ABC transporter permease subunit [Gammaproteobacteria bacterium]NIT63818.1 ABC transporter permease subunit [Gammaproteobacteria bacterium]NIV20771.1 ABC transporter permease subunit [Gammaproteobacteria bacterium]NIX10906.1 ABC transporter permease subunit [Gammaproteobacteria bacterium]